MASFFEALDRTSSSHPDHDGLVRIAVFGDSFIEADIFTADLREMLQKRFGGCGVGFVTITSMTSGYRPTVRHTFEGWSSHAVTDSVYFDRRKQGISGHYFIPGKNAYVELVDRINMLLYWILAGKHLSFSTLKILSTFPSV